MIYAFLGTWPNLNSIAFLSGTDPSLLLPKGGEGGLDPSLVTYCLGVTSVLITAAVAVKVKLVQRKMAGPPVKEGMAFARGGIPVYMPFAIPRRAPSGEEGPSRHDHGQDAADVRPHRRTGHGAGDHRAERGSFLFLFLLFLFLRPLLPGLLRPRLLRPLQVRRHRPCHRASVHFRFRRQAQELRQEEDETRVTPPV